MRKSKCKLQCLFFLLFVIFGCQLMSAQQISIKGTVTDQSGEPLIGVSVTVPGTKIGAATDIDGNFGLTADAKAKLKFSYIGYLTIEEAVDGRSVINVVMKENSEVLSEVVVIGYGTMDKKELTSAISHVSEKDFLSVSSLDPSMMIQGKVPGVSITNTGAGDPNNQASIQIRGVSSRSAGLGPLIARRQPYKHQPQRYRLVRHSEGRRGIGNLRHTRL